MIRTLLLISILFMMTGHSNVYGQSLDSILQLVVENNLELKSLHLEYETELLNIEQVRQLQNPEFGVGIPVLQPETRLGPQVMMIGASQMFPWFGTQQAKEDVVISMSKAKYERISSVRLELFNKVEIAYHQLVFLEAKQKVLSNIIVQFEALYKVALSKVEGGGSMANPLRIQLKMDELNQMLLKLNVSKESLYAKINALTFQPWETVIQPEAIGLQVLDFDLEAYKVKIKEHYPMILKMNKEIEVSRNKQIVSKKMGSPMIGIGLDYALVNERTDMNPEYNGRDILVPKVKLSIPIYRKSYRAIQKQETLRQNTLELRKESLETRIIGELLKHKSEYDNALLDIELNERQVETTNIVLNLLLTEYSNNNRDFDDLLQIQNQLLNYEIGLEKAMMRSKIAVSNIKRFTDY